jgi:hypothetical protein
MLLPENERRKKSRGCCGDFLKLCDYFGVPFNFKFKDKEKYQSRFGGFVFIVFLFFSVVYFLLNFLQFFQRNVYTVNTSTKVVSPSPYENFTKLEFNFAFSLQWDNNTLLDEETLKLFDLSSNKVIYKNSKDKIKTPLKFKNCTESDFYNKSIDQFHQLQLSQFNCLDSEDDLAIQGGFSDAIYEYIDIGIFFSKNLDLKDESTLKRLKDFFSQNQLKFSIYFLDTTIDVENSQSPISWYINTYVTYLDFTMLKKTNMDFSILKFSDDQNILLNKPDKKENLQLGQKQEYSASIPDRSIAPYDNNITLLKFFFRASPSITIIDRSYQKLTEFLANMGGLISNLLLVIFVVVTFFNKFWGEENILNKILKYKEHLKYKQNENYVQLSKNLRRVNEETQAKNKDSSKYSSDPNKELEIDLGSRRESLQISEHHLNIQQKKNQDLGAEEEKVIKKSKKPLEFNFCEIMMKSLGCKTKSVKVKTEIHQKAADKFNYYMDIFTYIKKMQEIDLIKYLLLNKDQITLFNFISKPSISLLYGVSDDIYQDIEKNREISHKIKEDELEDIIRSYNKLKLNHDAMNKKLFYVFDYEMDHLLD